MRLGIIADTHGLLRPEVHEVFREVDLIIHAGDVGDPSILDELLLIARVVAVYGNTDSAVLRTHLPEVARENIDGFEFVVTHGDQLGSPEPQGLKEMFPEADVIIYGHTHKPLIYDFPDFSLTLNPGAAGPRRFDLPVCVAIMETEAGIPPRARIVPLL